MEEKKIGILTFHRAHNYGAVLQVFALQEILEKEYFVNVIDYSPKFLTAPYKIFKLETTNNSEKPFIALKNIILSLLTLKSGIKRKRNFNYFINNRLRLSKKVVANGIPQDFDVYIFGSDQIWNHEITNGIDNVYWGDFAAKPEAKKISYAASLGHAKIDRSLENKATKFLNNFDAISVREKDAIPILRPVCQSPISEVLDPTLLPDYEFWVKNSKRPNIEQKYILVYQVRQHPNTLVMAKKMAKEIGGTVVEIPAKLSKKSVCDKYAGTSPTQFLGYFLHAHCVLTTSFHGTAFSIIFNKPFFTLNLKDGSENRSKNLLDKLGLSDRMIDKDSLPNFRSIDYELPNLEIQKLRKRSIDFLISSIESKN